MSDTDILAEYIWHLTNAGINVPKDVQDVIDRMRQRQIEDHGK